MKGIIINGYLYSFVTTIHGVDVYTDGLYWVQAHDSEICILRVGEPFGARYTLNDDDVVQWGGV